MTVNDMTYVKEFCKPQSTPREFGYDAGKNNKESPIQASLVAQTVKNPPAMQEAWV